VPDVIEKAKKPRFDTSVSGEDKESPTCNDCHKSHEIEWVDREDFRNEIFAQCGNCHKDVVETYFETYHGKVSKLGCWMSFVRSWTISKLDLPFRKASGI